MMEPNLGEDGGGWSGHNDAFAFLVRAHQYSRKNLLAILIPTKCVQNPSIIS
jgi:hypothetical protein